MDHNDTRPDIQDRARLLGLLEQAEQAAWDLFESAGDAGLQPGQDFGAWTDYAEQVATVGRMLPVLAGQVEDHPCDDGAAEDANVPAVVG